MLECLRTEARNLYMHKPYLSAHACICTCTCTYYVCIIYVYIYIYIYWERYKYVCITFVLSHVHLTCMYIGGCMCIHTPVYIYIGTLLCHHLQESLTRTHILCIHQCMHMKWSMCFMSGHNTIYSHVTDLHINTIRFALTHQQKTCVSELPKQ